MKRIFLIVLLGGLWAPGGVFAQAMFPAGDVAVLPSARGVLPPFPLILADSQPVPTLGPTAELALMAPELALATYQKRAAEQAAALASYSAVTVVRAELPRVHSRANMSCKGSLKLPTPSNSRPCITAETGSSRTTSSPDCCRVKWITCRKTTPR